jgi:hypothetical protein
VVSFRHDGNDLGGAARVAGLPSSAWICSGKDSFFPWLLKRPAKKPPVAGFQDVVQANHPIE